MRKDAEESWDIIDELPFYGDESWDNSHDVTSVVKAISSLKKIPHLSEENLRELERRFDYLIKKKKGPLSPNRATVNSISNKNAAPLSESPLMEKAKSFQKYTQPYPPP